MQLANIQSVNVLLPEEILCGLYFNKTNYRQLNRISVWKVFALVSEKVINVS